MQDLLNNEVFVYCAMAVLVFGITQGLKWVFVKPWTGKLENERARKAINTVIYFLPYAVGVGLEILYATYVSKAEPNLVVGAISGGAGHSVYALYERIYSVITGNKYKASHATNEQEKAVDEFVDSVVADNKIDKSDKSKLDVFLEKIKQ